MGPTECYQREPLRLEVGDVPQVPEDWAHQRVSMPGPQARPRRCRPARSMNVLARASEELVGYEAGVRSGWGRSQS